MVPQRKGSGSKNTGNGAENIEEEVEYNGYIRVFMKPLEQGNYSVILGWLGIQNVKMNPQQSRLAYGLTAVIASVLLYHLLFRELGFLFHRLCALVIPIFSVSCAFYWLALYFRKSWSTTSIYVLFCSSFAGEFVGQCLCDSSSDHYITQPFLAFSVLVSISIASIFSTLETTHSTFVIIFVSFIRFLSCTSLSGLPQMLRPFLAYFSGIVGVIGAKYMETVFKPPVATNLMTQDGKIPVIKRRRSSASTSHAFTTHRAGRRTSLPALIQKSQTPTSSYESAIIGEAHGLISDMLADSSLPPHVVSGLRAVSNLLKPPENHAPVHKPKVSLLVSLTEATNYGSDNEDLPYTGERPSSLPKRLRRSLPPSLIRRMSTSTWTTTTSATGMPTLEPEPCRTRSSSFRHSRESTPGSSPVGSRSNSPSPSSPTTISLTIPKSRSFSLANAPAPSSLPQRKAGRERRSLPYSSAQSDSCLVSSTKTSASLLSSSSTSPCADMPNKPTTPLTGDPDQRDTSASPAITTKEMPTGLSKRLNITSDYESSDSPSSSDHSDNLTSLEDTSSGESPKLKTAQIELTSTVTSLQHKEDNSSKDTTTTRTVNASSQIVQRTNSLEQELSQSSTRQSSRDSDSAIVAGFSDYPVDVEHVTQNKELLEMRKLNQWDYPIFEVSDAYPDCILSLVAYKLFHETGLIDTFRIPLPEFLNYFHALELGYRTKPYHNRVHATDVLHGVYYLVTQPIPGFQHVNPDGDVFHKQVSSSESDSEGEKLASVAHRTSFTAEDSYGIMGGNFPALELMALYTAAAMHDYDHPGRTNAFLVATHAPLAVLYNDRSVLESHHAASAWRLFLSDRRFDWLQHLDKAEFKRFRFLVIEAIIATDLKRHFEMLAEFNAKVNDDDAVGIDWTTETDRIMVANMVIKMADINGPAKMKDLHTSWTTRISEEFYEQGDEEAGLGLPISPYMDRKHPQLAKLQESFINHLVAPLCNALGAAGLLPGTWVEDELSDGEGAISEGDSGDNALKDTEDEEELNGDPCPSEKKCKRRRKVSCALSKNLKDNHDMWVEVLKKEVAQKERDNQQLERTEQKVPSITEKEAKPSEMEPIKEEDTPPNSANSLKDHTSPASSSLPESVATTATTTTPTPSTLAPTPTPTPSTDCSTTTITTTTTNTPSSQRESTTSQSERLTHRPGPLKLSLGHASRTPEKT